ncbi:MAG: hypothetical protein Q7T55_22210 [Solirubrobacteraceae bacterium]|nr:hypothetical protein [Solirubrobacteraceae bacterium]
MVWLYVIGGVVALIGFAIWQLFATVPTDIIGRGLLGLGVLIAFSMELVGWVLLPLRLLAWLDTSDTNSRRDRKADKAAQERAAMRARTAARQAAREQAAREPAAPS